MPTAAHKRTSSQRSLYQQIEPYTPIPLQVESFSDIDRVVYRFLT